jgi:8-oxo-dGTP diphosphatase
MGETRFMRALERRLRGDLRLIQIREPQMTPGSLERFASAVVEMAHAHGARVLVNEDSALAARTASDGVHLKSTQLGSLRERPRFELVGASCHDARELRLAADVGADLVVLGPVAPTPTHPGSATMGWSTFEQLVRGFELPVYALGGMRMSDLETAWARGAHGIGMQRGAWE